MTESRLAVLIPAFNEASTVGAVAKVALSAQIGPVLIVSDGSTDRTVDVARSAGARVLALPSNCGKGGAVSAGVEALNSELVLLLDADLTGLTPKHLRDLAEPVLSGEADTTIGLFTGGRARTDFAQRIAPQLSGQRVISRSLLAGIKDLATTKYAIELAINRAIEDGQLRVQYVQLPGVAQVMKEEKLGVARGLARRIRMYWQIARYAVRGLPPFRRPG
jgi:glycosyltransferase involved in cell wall biosynthesis